MKCTAPVSAPTVSATVPKLIAVLGDELVACAITWY